jgi:recombination protein RecT
MGTIQKAAEQAEEGRQLAKVGGKTLGQMIEDQQVQFARALPRHVSAERFTRMALTAIRVNPKLAQCEATSVLAGLMQAAQLGVEISDVRGQAYLIPRWSSKLGSNEASFQLGYRGMIDLAARAGITVDVDVIHANDQYEFRRGTDARLVHIPTLADPGDPIAYYAVAHFSDSRPAQFVLMSHTQMVNHMERFASSKNKSGDVYGPWKDHFDAMACKTVIRRLLDRLPTSAELREAQTADAAADDGGPVPVSYNVRVDVPAGVDAVTGEVLGELPDVPYDAIDTEGEELFDSEVAE